MKKNSWWPPVQTTAGAVVTLVIAGVAALATTTIETSTMVAMAILMRVRLWFICFAFLDALRVKKKESKTYNGGVMA
jgi:amino acid transporter